MSQRTATTEDGAKAGMPRRQFVRLVVLSAGAWCYRFPAVSRPSPIPT